jgi:hypothetical protein
MIKPTFNKFNELHNKKNMRYQMNDRMAKSKSVMVGSFLSAKLYRTSSSAPLSNMNASFASSAVFFNINIKVIHYIIMINNMN